MVKRRSADERQSDFFGGADQASAPAARAPRPQERRSKGRPGGTDEPAEPAPAAPAAEAAPAETTPAALAARATRPELDEFVGALSDEGLAHLAVVSVRALRRRLAKGAAPGARGSKGRATGTLERAARQLAADLGGAGAPAGEDG
jgi:hypothetical protein